MVIYLLYGNGKQTNTEMVQTCDKRDMSSGVTSSSMSMYLALLLLLLLGFIVLDDGDAFDFLGLCRRVTKQKS